VVIYTTVALCTTAYVRDRRLHVLAWIAAVVLPLCVATARVYRGMHHPLDVLSGVVLGVLALAVAVAAIEAWAAASDGRPPERERARDAITAADTAERPVARG
jgi:undecaprenyl-diphosphatase